MKSPAGKVTPPALPTLPPFPIEALPEKTRQIVGEIQHHTHAPVSTITSAVLCAVASAAQFRIKIEHGGQDKRLSWPSLFMVNVDDSGANKNEAFRRAFGGLHSYQQSLTNRVKKKYDATKLRLQQAERDLANTEPDAPRYENIIQAIKTLQAELKRIKLALGPKSQFIQSHAENLTLSKIATQSGWRAAIINSEADGALEAKSLKKLDSLSRGWDSQDQRELTVAEKMVAKSRDQAMDAGLYRHSPHISVCLAMRPQAICQHINKKKSLAHVGSFIERCLFTWVSQDDRKIAHPDNGNRALESFHKLTLLLAGLDVERTMSFNDESRDIENIGADYEKIYAMHCVNFPGFETYLSYQYENTLRIATVLELIERDFTLESRMYITTDILASAKALIQWHIQTYLFIFFTCVQNQTQQDARAIREKLQTIATKKMKAGLKPEGANPNFGYSIGRNEVYQQRPDRKVGTERFNQAIALLCRQCLIREYQLPTRKKCLWLQTDPWGNLVL